MRFAVRQVVVGVCCLVLAGAAKAGWVSVLSEDFESTFPSAGWEVLDNYAGDGAQYCWGDVSTAEGAPSGIPNGTWCGWCVAGGAQGYDPSGANYPPYSDAWLMTTNWIDISDSTDVTVDFYHWVDTEGFDDTLWVGVSIDGTNFYPAWLNYEGAYSISGDISGWEYEEADLSDVQTLGDVAGTASEVKIAIIFDSDDDGLVGAGAFIDWIDINKYVEDDYEDNDTLATATDLTAYENTWLNTISGYASTDDEDWYEIYVFAGWERVVIDCTFTHAGGDIDIELVDDTGTPVAVSDGTLDNEHIDFEVALGDATYYVRVYGDTSGNTYDLRWNTLEPGGGVTIWCGQVPSDAGPGMAVAAILFAGSLLALKRKAAVARA